MRSPREASLIVPLPRRTTVRAAVAALILAAAPYARAQGVAGSLDSWRHVRYTQRDGLRSLLVNSLAESERGTLWVSTTGGISWFDGWSFRPAKEASDLLGREAVRLRPMSGDSMLAVVHGLVFVGDTSGFTRLKVVVDGKEEQVRDAVWGDGALYLIVLISDVADSMRFVRWRDGRAESLPAPGPLKGFDVPSLHQGRNGAIWMVTADGLHERTDGRWRLRIPSGGGLIRVPVIREGSDGQVIVSVTGEPRIAGTWEWRGDGAPRRDASEGVDDMLDATIDRPGSIFAVRRGGFIRHWRNGRWTAFDDGDLSLTDSRAILRDRTGDLWIGTGLGLQLVRESSRLWSGAPHGFPDRGDLVNAILDQPNGDRWVATAGGIFITHRDGREERLAHADGLPIGPVTTLARDSSGNVWVGSGAGLVGALRFDGRRWRHFTRRDGLGAEHVHRIVVAPNGVVWLLGIGGGDYAVANGPGAFSWDGSRFAQLDTSAGLPSGRVYDFAEAPDGTQWFGTAGGLSRRRAGQWTHWTTRSGRVGTMMLRNSPIRVFTLDLDASGTPWFGDGLNEVAYGLGTIEADTLRFFGADKGLLSNVVRSVRVARDGTVWAGTANGLSALNEGTVYNFGTDRGLGFPQIWPVHVNDTSVAVGTLGGGVRVLSLREVRPQAPKVLLAEPLLANESATFSWTPLSWRGVVPSTVIETRWRIDGGAWSRWSTERTATLPLRRGTHRFEVQPKRQYPPLDAPIAVAEVFVPGGLLLRPAFYVPIGALMLTVLVLLVRGAQRQRRAEIVLRESELRFRSLASSTSEGIAICVDGRVVEANDQLHQLLRVVPGALMDRRIDSIVRPDPGAPLGTRDGGALAGLVQRDDGTAFPADVRESALTFRGAPARVTAIHDLSDREAAVRALRASEERFETMFRKSPTAITLSSWPDVRLVDVSQGFERLTGLARSEVIGRNSLELGLYVDLTQRAALIATLATDGRAENAPLTLKRRDGALRDVIGTYERLQLDGQPHVLGVLTDITERRTLEAQLLQSQKMEAVGRLAGGIAHDFNNLLTVILGHTDMLRHAADHPEDQQDVEEIRAAAQRAADLTRQLLTFARKQRIAPELLDLNEIVPRTRRMLDRLLGERITVEADIAPDVPLVVMDAGQLEQVLVNLAVNARDAMPQGGRLTIEAKEALLDDTYAREHAQVAPGRYAVISLTDTGSGIPPEALPRIFEPFFTTKEVGQGTGLGLAICYGIVREAGGHIGVYSEVGKGTTVRVYLPARTASRRRSPVPEPRALVGGSERVLLVEDEALVRNLVERVLRSLGYRVTSAGDHTEAMAALEGLGEPPQLLVTDVVLPGPSGPEIARAVRTRVPGIPVLYMSGYTERGANPTAALDAPLLSKPFTPEQLATNVRMALESRRDRADGTPS